MQFVWLVAECCLKQSECIEYIWSVCFSDPIWSRDSDYSAHLAGLADSGFMFDNCYLAYIFVLVAAVLWQIFQAGGYGTFSIFDCELVGLVDCLCNA